MTRRPSRHARAGLLAAMLASALVALIGLTGPVASAGAATVPDQHRAAAAGARGDSYSAPLTQAIADLPVATEDNSDYERSAFRLWTDADGDGCDTRAEVLIDEADDAPTRGSGCSLTGGRWYSYYDATSYTDAGHLDIDHVVPLGEAWGSGARAWSAQTREDYANDLGDHRTLIAVDLGDNRSKGEKDIAEWTPAHQVCRYLDDWVAIKHRWGLTVDSTEKSAMRSLAGDCGNTTITVTLAR